MSDDFLIEIAKTKDNKMETLKWWKEGKTVNIKFYTLWKYLWKLKQSKDVIRSKNFDFISNRPKVWQIVKMSLLEAWK